jgi:hypothetical protein
MGFFSCLSIEPHPSPVVILEDKFVVVPLEGGGTPHFVAQQPS